jgi:hypothetical protein
LVPVVDAVFVAPPTLDGALGNRSGGGAVSVARAVFVSLAVGVSRGARSGGGAVSVARAVFVSLTAGVGLGDRTSGWAVGSGRPTAGAAGPLPVVEATLPAAPVVPAGDGLPCWFAA